MDKYSPKTIEKKWQERWEKNKAHVTNLKDTKKKFYNLIMYPYPSGDKLHIGHWYAFAPSDTVGRYLKMHGYNVFEPIGFDSFGLPAENYAIKKGVHPIKSIAKNTEVMRGQLRAMGTMYDWEKEVVTSSPNYYKWTQWLFLVMRKAGLAEKRFAPVNWCPKCQTVLANEQVLEGKCERCNSEITHKNLSQWFFKITDYAEKLLDFGDVDWPEQTIAGQTNWIGKSVGADVIFKIAGSDKKITVFTTRPDTLFGATFIVFAPEHPIIRKITKQEYKKNVEEYIEKTKKIKDITRTSTVREKTGVFTGAYAVNPVNNQKIPIYIADYVLSSYGTGAIMAVPAHDGRDWEFAKKYNIPIIKVVAKDEKDAKTNEIKKLFEGEGIVMNSGVYDGLTTNECKERIIEDLNKNEKGKKSINYKLRDWLVSRQRYWGAPIPMINCGKCGQVEVPVKNLPVKLPKNVDFRPRGDGKSPLAHADEFVNCKCPKCGKNAERETDTMDTFVCSSWYQFRYVSAHDDKQPWDKEILNKWLPVDLYIGGAEHTVMHLLYARFVAHVLKDQGYITFKEPFYKLRHQGIVTKNGAKMSKSKGNVVSPDEYVEKYGSDVFRMSLMFLGPYKQMKDWQGAVVDGIKRFLERIWEFALNDKLRIRNEELVMKSLHKTIKKVTEDIPSLRFNTAIASLMEFINVVAHEGFPDEAKRKFVQILSPFAPHLGEELWERLGGDKSVFLSVWPKFEKELVKENNIELAVQINGKIRARLHTIYGISKEKAVSLAKGDKRIKEYLQNGKIIKKIFVPNKLINFVVK